MSVPALTTLALVLSAAASPAPVSRPVSPTGARGEYQNERGGFRLELPDGWVAGEKAGDGPTLHVTFAPEGSEDVQLSLRVYPEASVGGPEAVRKLAVGSVEGQEDYSRLELGTARVGDVEDAPAFQIDKRTDDGTLRVHQRYVTDRGRSFVLQSVARRASFRRHARTFDEVWASFEVLPPTAEEAADDALRALAARCGSQLDWAGSWDEAAARARAEHKLVLVTAWIYRGFNLPDATLSAVFTDPDVVELVAERYVPFRLTSELDVPFADPDVYGLGPFTFGSAALLVTPEGEVVDEAGAATYGFLARGVDRHPAYPGPPLEPVPADPLERGTQRLRRGELEQALIDLVTLDDPAAHRQLAILYRRLLRPDDALRELELALEAAPGDGRLQVERAELLYRAGRADEARAALEGLLEGGAEGGLDAAARPAALYWLGAGRLRAAGPGEAEEVWTRLLDEHPDSPFAWRAAATMTGPAYALGRFGRLAWPPADVVTQLRIPEPEPLGPDEAARAERDAAGWLLAHQREDGSWLSPTGLLRRPEAPPDDFELAITAICLRALAGRGERDPGAGAAVERALDWLLDAYERSYASGGEVHFMDYGVWSRAYVLTALAEAAERGWAEPDALAGPVAHLVEELTAKQKPGGGWSYYVKSDLASDATSDRSISFTTAAVVLALQGARAAGLDVPAELVEDGLDCLERTRARSGAFEYFDDAASARGAGAGAAGRGPVCALALYRGGRTGLDEVRDALDLLLAHRAGLDRECGKVLMHTGPDAQGSHYLLFDYATAARALGELPRRERARYVEPLRELVLHARRAGGGFVDNASRGVAYGAGMGLTALELLRDGG